MWLDIVPMYFETYNGERYFAFFSAVSKCGDMFLEPQSATSSKISLKLWLSVKFFLIIKNVILKKHLKIKQLLGRLVSPNYKDALNVICQTLAFLLDIFLNVICQTLAFLLDIFLKHCLFFTNNVWQFEFKWSENLAEGCSHNFPGLSTKAL